MPKTEKEIQALQKIHGLYLQKSLQARKAGKAGPKTAEIIADLIETLASEPELESLCFDALGVAPGSAHLSFDAQAGSFKIKATTIDTPPRVKAVTINPLLVQNEFDGMMTYNIMDRFTATSDEPHAKRVAKFALLKEKGSDPKYDDIFKRYTLSLLGARYERFFQRSLFAAIPKAHLQTSPGTHISLSEFCELVKPSVTAKAKTGEIVFEFEFNGYKAGFKLTLDSPKQKMTYSPFIDSKRGAEPIPDATLQSMAEKIFSFKRADYSALGSLPHNRTANLMVKEQPISFSVPKLNSTQQTRRAALGTPASVQSSTAAVRGWPPTEPGPRDGTLFPRHADGDVRAAVMSGVKVQLKNKEGIDVVEDLPYSAFNDLSTLKKHLSSIYGKHQRMEKNGSDDLRIVLPQSEQINPSFKPQMIETLTQLRAEKGPEKWSFKLIVPKTPDSDPTAGTKPPNFKK